MCSHRGVLASRSSCDHFEVEIASAGVALGGDPSSFLFAGPRPASLAFIFLDSEPLNAVSTFLCTPHSVLRYFGRSLSCQTSWCVASGITSACKTALTEDSPDPSSRSWRRYLLQALCTSSSPPTDEMNPIS